MTTTVDIESKIIDLLTQLDRATPNPPAFAELSQYTEVDRSRIVPVLAAAAVVAVGVAGLVAVGHARDREPATPSVSDTSQSAEVDPTTSTLSADRPAGSAHQLSWHQLVPPAFSLEGYSYVGTLADGRAVLWNGTEAMESVEEPRATGLVFYDPAADTWSQSSPFVGAQLWGSDAEVVGNSVIVHQYMNDGSIDRFARYDIAADVWTASPDLPGMITLGWAADDTTIAAWTFPADDRSTRTLLRWSGETTWQPATAAPFTLRDNEGTGHDGATLAIYGGLSSTASDATVAFPASDGAPGDAPTVMLNDDAPYAVLDGGVYDVTTDTWSAIPRSPLTGVANPTVLVDAGTVVVAGGLPAGSSSGFLGQLATYQQGVGWRLSTSDPAWRGGGVTVVGRTLITSNNDGYLVSEAPFDSWQANPGKDIQISWQPVPLGHAKYLQAYHDDATVSFLLADSGMVSEAPPTPWATSPDTGYDEAVIPTPGGPIVIDSTAFRPWQLATDQPNAATPPANASTTPTTPAPTEPPECAAGVYTLITGDTPALVAAKFDITLDQLTAENSVNPQFKQWAEGATITIPPALDCSSSAATN